VARLVAYAKEHNLPLGTLVEGSTADPEYTLVNGPQFDDQPVDADPDDHG
jgi:hypothetical protein